MNKGRLIAALSIVGIIVITIISVVSFTARNAKDFAFEQQPNADSIGELIGMQYSQLRDLAADLDSLSCKLDVNGAAQQQMIDINGDTPQTEWRSEFLKEMQNLRWEEQAMRQRYASLAADYNELRGDVRTIADNLGLEVDVIEVAREYSPDGSACGKLSMPPPNTPVDKP